MLYSGSTERGWGGGVEGGMQQGKGGGGSGIYSFVTPFFE